MKVFERIMKVMTWAAWVAFMLGLATLETPNTFSALCLLFSTVWLIAGALVQEAIGDEP